jgi:hypothetical protein
VPSPSVKALPSRSTAVTKPSKSVSPRSSSFSSSSSVIPSPARISIMRPRTAIHASGGGASFTTRLSLSTLISISASSASSSSSSSRATKEASSGACGSAGGRRLTSTGGSRPSARAASTRATNSARVSVVRSSARNCVVASKWITRAPSCNTIVPASPSMPTARLSIFSSSERSSSSSISTSRATSPSRWSLISTRLAPSPRASPRRRSVISRENCTSPGALSLPGSFGPSVHAASKPSMAPPTAQAVLLPIVRMTHLQIDCSRGGAGAPRTDGKGKDQAHPAGHHKLLCN